MHFATFLHAFIVYVLRLLSSALSYFVSHTIFCVTVFQRPRSEWMNCPVLTRVLRPKGKVLTWKRLVCNLTQYRILKRPLKAEEMVLGLPRGNIKVAGYIYKKSLPTELASFPQSRLFVEVVMLLSGSNPGDGFSTMWPVSRSGISWWVNRSWGRRWTLLWTRGQEDRTLFSVLQGWWRGHLDGNNGLFLWNVSEG